MVSLRTAIWQVCPALPGEAGKELGHWSLDGLSRSHRAEESPRGRAGKGLDQGEEVQKDPDWLRG